MTKIKNFLVNEFIKITFAIGIFLTFSALVIKDNKDIAGVLSGLGTGLVTSTVVTLLFNQKLVIMKDNQNKKYKETTFQMISSNTYVLYSEILDVNNYCVRNNKDLIMIVDTQEKFDEMVEYIKNLYEEDREGFGKHICDIHTQYYDAFYTCIKLFPSDYLLHNEIINDREYEILKDDAWLAPVADELRIVKDKERRGEECTYDKLLLLIFALEKICYFYTEIDIVQEILKGSFEEWEQHLESAHYYYNYSPEL